MSKALHELLAVKPDAQRRASEVEKETKGVLSEKSLFTGMHRSYSPLEESTEFTVEPDEVVPLSYTVKEKVDWFAEQFSRIMDIELQIDETNMGARASLTLDGLSLEDVPATYLIDLINYVERIRGVLKKAQALDPRFEWEGDPTQRPGVWKATRAETTYRTKKALVHKVLVDATKEHPAQVEKWNEDVRIGKYTRQIWSGAITPAEKADVLARCDQIIEASKKALADANKTEHSARRVAADVFDFILQAIG